MNTWNWPFGRHGHECNEWQNLVMCEDHTEVMCYSRPSLDKVNIARLHGSEKISRVLEAGHGFNQNFSMH